MGTKTIKQTKGKTIIQFCLFCILTLLVFSCKQNAQVKSINQTSLPNEYIPSGIDFDADSAYKYIEEQLAFGFRIPSTKEHDACAVYLEQKLQQYTQNIVVQKETVIAYNNKPLRISNIIASFNPEKTKRVLLLAHWDSRPFADNEKLAEKQRTPIMGANDGASGVAVLIEIARLIAENNIEIGVDILLTDAEDYGQPAFYTGQHRPDTWCLGTQHWANTPHKTGYYAQYGILLDMVGAKNAVFTKEGASVEYAPHIVNKVWDIAQKSGFGAYFSSEKTQHIIDDHVYVNKIAGIPCIDIIQYDHSTRSHFGDYWHTEKDNIQIIDKSTLKAVGQTVIETIYSE